MSSFNLACKILHIKMKTQGDLIAYVIFPFSNECATQDEIALNNQRFISLGFGKKYVCFYPSKFNQNNDELKFEPWLTLTSDECISIELEDVIFATPIDQKYEAQYQKFLDKRKIKIEPAVFKYMEHLGISPDEPIDDHQRPLIPGVRYIFDDSIPAKRTIH